MAPSTPPPSAISEFYRYLNEIAPSSALPFLNYGYTAGGAEPHLEAPDGVWRYSRALISRTLRLIRIRGARVLDVGCGRGGPAAFVARHLAPQTVTGVDACPEAIAFCRMRHREPRLSFDCCDAMRLPYEASSFDVVMNVESSHCYSDRPGFLSEVVRVLAPGGVLCYADTFPAHAIPLVVADLRNVPRMRIASQTDITAGVARAIALNRDDLTAHVRAAFRGDGSADAFGTQLLFNINVRAVAEFTARRWQYYVWQCPTALV